MRKVWLLSFLLLTGCSQLVNEPAVEEKTPQQQLAQMQEEILTELEQQQLILGETKQQDLQNYKQLDDNHFTLSDDFSVAIQTKDQLVEQLTITLPEQVAAENIETTFTFEENVEGQWLVEQNMVTALQLTRTAPTFKQQIYSLPLAEKVGQMLMIGMDGTTVSKELKQALQQHIGHVILFKKNITSTEQLRALITGIDAVETDFPVWVGIDEEGGSVSRLPNELVKLPSAHVLASKYSAIQVEAISKQLGVALASNGIDIDFAPVMDVNSNPQNPVIGKRAFSVDADVVSNYAGHFANGLQQAGVQAVAKHFPGHGDTTVDSHIGLPIINKSIEQLQQLELRPFQQAVDQGIDSIMVGHLLVPALDANEPASLSSKIVTDLLREQWHYDGIIITDDLTMGALNLPLPQAILQAVQAGNDIALANGTLADVLAGQQLVVQAVEKGTIPLEQINESAYRILERKKEQPLQNFSVQQWNQEMQKLLNK
ncbi:MAG: beta-N-acetylhexosaminidase [Kurthia sp.]|uniref:beta-N-acetylhexosaminidase n=1 Tax=unclassified Lysinibacillus TaxID=2636778 RepID=UPI000D52884F|nr:MULTISPECIES: beta-N-acetylhexosaminidase [unclassified Lysinibacillus]AWE08223.1 beta-N-acetylhexosaminidase [Lysinibacillus sp. 2017]MBQ0138264.1 beta-N-acetylhexosaminidase [Candidatus Kurthia equi]TGN36274.1 beta-N-acetylhexosaminidase [Lysinibacillus sp. S2017]